MARGDTYNNHTLPDWINIDSRPCFDGDEGSNYGVEAMTGIVYFVGNPDGLGCIKVGHTREPCIRLRLLQLWSPLHLEILAFCSCDKEYYFHERYAAHRSHGEWFNRCELIDSDMKAMRDGTFSLGCLPDTFNFRGKVTFWLPKGERANLLEDGKAILQRAMG